MSDPNVILWITLTFLLAGAVKGIVGSGLPTIALGVLTAVLGLHSAMALMLVPTIVTNLWQALIGGHVRAVGLRIWPFLLASAAAIWIGAEALTRVKVSWLAALLGFLLALYGFFGLLRPPLAIPQSKQMPIGIVAGLLSGVLGGMTGSLGVPGIPYLQAIGLPRDQLIQALGMLFAVSSISLAAALAGQRLLGVDLGLASALATIPALIGMAIGQKLRQLLPEQRFRKIFFASQVALGGYIVLRAMM
jgi:uncharacterized membrane protein YfcA